MKIKIGIVEDEKLYFTQLSTLLDDWAVLQNCLIDYDVYVSGEKLLDSDVLDYDILFVDIQLGNINGMETANKLRSKHFTGEIVFLTAFKEYVFEGYGVHALDYILKPITADKLNACMNTLLHTLQSEHYILKKRDVIQTIPYQELIYLLSSGHHVEFVTTQTSYKHLISIKNVMKHLPSPFVQCHRTIILNVNHIRKLDGRTVVMSNQQSFPVSSTYLGKVQKKLERLVL